MDEVLKELRAIKATLSAIALSMGALNAKAIPGVTYYDPNDITDIAKLPPKARAELDAWANECDKDMTNFQTSDDVK